MSVTFRQANGLDHQLIWFVPLTGIFEEKKLCEEGEEKEETKTILTLLTCIFLVLHPSFIYRVYGVSVRPHLAGSASITYKSHSVLPSSSPLTLHYALVAIVIVFNIQLVNEDI